MAKKHRTGIGYEPRAPSGLMEHSIHGKQMEKSFQSSVINKIIGFFMKIMTSNTTLNVMRGMSGGKLIKIPKTLFDITATRIDKFLFEDTQAAKDCFLGKKTGAKYRSAFGGFFWELTSKYIDDWTKRQENKIKVEPIKRILQPMNKTYLGWKKLRDELQPGWEIFPKNPKKDHVKIFEEDSMSPLERVNRIVKGKRPDRVAYGPNWDYAIAFLGGSNLWKFAYDGIETAWAGVNTWLRIGGADFLPQSTGLAAYSIPFPDSHSRFFYKWKYPSDAGFPQFIEKELLTTYDQLYDYGFSGFAQEMTKRMVRDMFILVREIYYWLKVNKHYFGPYEKQFYPYAQLIFATWDVLPMWRSMIPFMKDMKRKPEEVIEAFRFINKPFTDLMIKLGKLTKAKTGLIGNSRGSNSFISPKMFEEIFWPSMKYTYNACFKAGIIPTCHFDNNWKKNMVFLAEKLPKRSCIFHLDQVDLVEVHDLIGDHFALMGAMSPALLVHQSPEKVEAETKRYIEHIGEDGLIIASGCELPADIPIQNIYAQKRAIKKYGRF